MPSVAAILKVAAPIVMRTVGRSYVLAPIEPQIDQNQLWATLGDPISQQTVHMTWLAEDDYKIEGQKIALATDMLERATRSLDGIVRGDVRLGAFRWWQRAAATVEDDVQDADLSE